MLAPEVATLLEAVPEFVDRFLCLVEDADGDPGAAASFTELADFVAELLAGADAEGATRARRLQGVLGRCLAGVERVAAESDDAEELVGWAFLDSLCPVDAERLHPRFGPRTLIVAETLGVPREPGPPRTLHPRRRGDPRN